MTSRWSYGNFAAVALLCAASFGLHEWRGGHSSSFLFYGTAALLCFALVSLVVGMRGVRAERAIAQSRFFAGDDAFVAVTVLRRSSLPSGWIVVTDIWTDGRAEYSYSRLLFPGVRSAIRFRYKLNKLARGRYRFVRIEVDSGDWMGLLRKKVVIDAETEFSVYPKPLTVSVAPRGALSEAGTAIAPRPSDVNGSPIVAGIRPHAAGDPLQRIHWKATARTGALQTKVTEPLESDYVAVVLDGSRGSYAGNNGDALFEACVRAAAALLEWTVRQRAFASLHAGGEQPLALPIARRTDYTAALELLSRARADGVMAAADSLLRESAGWPYSCTIVLVTAAVDESIVRAARILRSGRRQLTIWLVQSESVVSGQHRQWIKELASFGCRVDLLKPPRAHSYSPGGAEDVIA